MRSSVLAIAKVCVFWVAFALLSAPPTLLWIRSLEGRAGGDLELTPVTRLPLELVGGAAAISAAYLVARFFTRPAFRAMGLGDRERLLDAARGLVLGIALAGLVTTVLWLAGNLDTAAGARLPSLAALAALAIGMAGNALFQEVAFRGNLLGVALEVLKPSTAVAVSVVGFVAVHAGVFSMPWPISAIGAVNLSLAGLLLALAYLRSGSLWLPFGIHLGWNLSLALAGFAVTGAGLGDEGILFVLSGSALMTGGMAGPEGGLPGLLGPMTGIAVVLWLFPNRGDGPVRQEAV